jgi:hypothetical protein
LSIGIESWFWTSIAGIARFGIDGIAGTDGIGIDGIAGTDCIGIDGIAGADGIGIESVGIGIESVGIGIESVGIGIESVGIGIGVLIWVESLLLPSIYSTLLFAWLIVQSYRFREWGSSPYKLSFKRR